MNLTNIAVIESIVEEHAEEAAFLWILRDAAVQAPHYSLNDLADSDERVWEIWGHPLKGLSREKTPLPTKKYIFFRLSSYFRTSTASLYCHLFSLPLFLSYRFVI